MQLTTRLRKTNLNFLRRFLEGTSWFAKEFGTFLGEGGYRQWGLVILAGYAAGLSLWGAQHYRIFTVYLRQGYLPPRGAASLVGATLSSVLTTNLLWIAFSYAAKRSSGLSFSVVLRKAAGAFLPLLLLVPGLAIPYFESARSIFHITLFSLLVSLTLARLASLLPQANPARSAGFGSLKLALYTFIAIYIVVFAVLCIMRHRTFHSTARDLALFDQSIWNTTQGRFLYDSIREKGRLETHFQVILLFLVPIYYLFPRPETLLVVQAVVVGVAALPLYWLAREELKSELAGLAFGLAYLLSPLVHQANLFDFHVPTLEAPLVFFAFYFLRKRNLGRYAFFLILFLLCKEDTSVYVIALGIYAFLKVDKRVGLLTAGGAALWGVLLWKVFFPITRGGGEYRFFPKYAALGGSPGRVVSTLLFNPVYIGKHLAMFHKVQGVLRLLTPMAFLPLAGGASILIVLAPLLVNLLSGTIMISSLDHQYVATVYPFAFIAAVYAAKNLVYGRNRFAPIGRIVYGENGAIFSSVLLVSATLVSAYFSSPSPLGRYFPWENYRASQRDSVGYEMMRLIPSEAPLSAQTNFVPHLSHREKAYMFPKIQDAEFVFLDAQGFRFPGTDLYLFRVLSLMASRAFPMVAFDDGYMLFRRGADPSQAREHELAALAYLESEIRRKADRPAKVLLVNLYYALDEPAKAAEFLKALGVGEDGSLDWAWRVTERPSTARIDLGGGDLGYAMGFHRAEEGGGVTFRWSKARAKVRFPLPKDFQAKVLSLRIGDARPQSVPPATLRIKVNGKELAEVELPRQDWHIYTFPLPEELWEAKKLVVEFTTDTWRPSQGSPPSSDARRLGLAFDWVAVEDVVLAGVEGR